MKKPTLSVIMPMYNSEDIIKNLVEATDSLERVNNNFEIILVDDGSKNNCLEEAKLFKDKRVKIVGYKKNKGKGNAIKFGFNFVSGEYVAFVDSGRDLDPKQLKKFIQIMEESKSDIVIGSKRHKESIVHYPAFRKFMSLIYQTLNKILFNLNVRDTQVGIKLFKYSVLEKIMPKIAIKRFAFDLELLVIANKFKYKIIEAPIIMRYKFGSTISSKSVFWILWDTSAIFYRDKILKYYD